MSTEDIGSGELVLLSENPGVTKENREMNMATKQLPDGVHRINLYRSNRLAHTFFLTSLYRSKNLFPLYFCKKKGTDISQGPSKKVIWPHV